MPTGGGLDCGEPKDHTTTFQAREPNGDAEVSLKTTSAHRRRAPGIEDRGG